MICIIPMAGDGKRFKDKGYELPKPFLPLPIGNQIIDAVEQSLPEEVIQTIFICRNENKDYLQIKSRSNGTKTNTVLVKRQTKGPLDTILEAKQYLRSDEELLINYCDCWLPDNRCQKFVEFAREKKRYAATVCFPSDDPRFQREPSNRFAMAGIFWFRKASEFYRAAIGYRDDPNMSPGHIAFAMRFMGLNMAAAFVTDNYVDLGVPETYEIYCATHINKLLPLFS